MQGGIIHGLKAALFGGQSFDAGAPQTANFNRLGTLRVKNAPIVDVHIVESGEPLGGIGEPGVPPIAPAVANTYFQLLGKRLRTLAFLSAEVEGVGEVKPEDFFNSSFDD